MDNTGVDLELALDMVKLLAQELKVVRAQRREAEKRTLTPCTDSNRLNHEGSQTLIAENESLKSDNAALQEWVARLRDEIKQVSSIKSEEDAEMLTSDTSGKFARLLAENQDLIREKEDASRNREKLLILQEKYRRAKATVHEYNEILNGLRVGLRDCTQELEQSRKSVVSEIDFRDFLNNPPHEPVEGQIELSSISPYTRHHTRLHQTVKDVCKGPYFINCNEVIWSPSGIALGLVIKPAFQYNARSHGGTWIKLEDDLETGQQVDVCYLSGKTARYLGTYERLGEQSTMVIAPETLKHLDKEKLNFLSNRTTLFPDLVPPSQTRMIKNMFEQGVIKLRCFGIRRVAFNQIFAGKLQEMGKSTAQRDSPDGVVIPTPGITSGDDRERKRKRKRDPKSTTNSSRKKERSNRLLTG